MKHEIVVRLIVDSDDLPEGVRPDKHFDRILHEFRAREPETDWYVEQGILDTLRERVQGR